MFDSTDFPQSLSESQFEEWLEEGRKSKIPYAYLMVVWNEFDAKYIPVYVEHRNQLLEYPAYGETSGQESTVAAYDLFSESRVYVHRD